MFKFFVCWNSIRVFGYDMVLAACRVTSLCNCGKTRNIDVDTLSHIMWDCQTINNDKEKTEELERERGLDRPQVGGPAPSIQHLVLRSEVWHIDRWQELPSLSARQQAELEMSKKTFQSIKCSISNVTVFVWVSPGRWREEWSRVWSVEDQTAYHDDTRGRGTCRQSLHQHPSPAAPQ